MKIPTNMRLSEEAKQLLIILSQKLGVSETSIIEIAVRKFAETERVRSGTSEQAPHSNKTCSALIV